VSYNGSGTFNINSAGQPVVTGTVISSTAFNALTADLGTGLSTAITKDGQTVATARIPFAAGINSSLVTDSTSTTTGSIITAGGVGVAKALFVGTTANIAGTTTLAGVTATSITDSGLTAGRVTFASTAGLLADAAALAWDGTSLSATKFAGALNGTVGATTPAAGAFTTLSATGITTVAAGSAALPAIVSTTGTADTGLWFPAADTVAASTAGTERLRLDSSGNLGIGTTSPSATLDIKHADQTTGYWESKGLLIRDVTTANVGIGIYSRGPTEHYITSLDDDVNSYLILGVRKSSSVNQVDAITIRGSGNVGIGKADPNYKLEIVTDSAGKPGVGGLWTVVSDERIKSNIVPANLNRCYEIVKSVPLKHFGFAPGVYTDDQIQDKHNLGWIAQDVQKVFKNAVSVKPFTPAIGDVIEDCLDLNGGQMIAALYGCVQALMAKVEALENK